MIGDEQQAPAQAQTTALEIDVPGAMVGAPDTEFVTVQLPANTPSDKMRDTAIALAQQQVRSNFRGVQPPGSTGRGVGVQMPTMNAQAKENFAPMIQQVMASIPELAAFVAQLTPPGRVMDMAGSMAIPVMARAATNAIEGKPTGEGLLGDAAIGGALHLPTSLGASMMSRGFNKMKQALGTSPRTADLAERFGKSFVEEEMPAAALASRASASKEGVARATDRAVASTGLAQEERAGARDLLKGIKHPTAGELESQAEMYTRANRMGEAAAKDHALANVLEDVRYRSSMKGPTGGPTAVLPGSGLVTTAVRATGIPALVGQVASPAVAALKGTPARNIASARNLYRPANIATSETMGRTVSQIGRLLEALREAGLPTSDLEQQLVDPNAAAQLPQRRKPGQ